jgi:4-amino-4-deoxy-L-arabinose transferase-like glycosyltransferase
MPDDPAVRVAGTLRQVATMARTSRPSDLVRALPLWEKVALALILILAAFLDCFRIGAGGFGNVYYAAAVKTMLMSWRNFFFASFDPAGFVSVDKPPLGLWVQVGSGRIFGFNPVSLILPQAIVGVLCVVVLYALVRRTFGAPAGVLAGALLAISPINVVDNRDNIMESLLVVTTLLSAWAMLKAVETDDLRWLAAAGALLGVGFNIKMFEAYLILPACVLVYLACAPGPWRRRVRQLALMGVVLAVVSFAWVMVVDATPATARPYVDSTLTNSELDLAFNYNGAQRVLGQPAYGGEPKPPSAGTGEPGPLRLFQPELGGQVSWFLPLALVGLLASIWELAPLTRGFGRWWRRGAAKQSAFVFWVTWLVTAMLFFSTGRFYNRHSLVMLAPALCALAGIGLIGMWRDARRGGWRGWLLPAALLATGAEQGVILSGYRNWHPWLLPAILLAVGLGMALAIALKAAWRPQEGALTVIRRRCGALVSGLVLAALLVAPLLWLATSFTPANEGGFPVSGPVAGDSAGSGVPVADPKLIGYLEARAGHTRFLVATNMADDAAPIILATGAPVMAMGGFSGYDPILTPARLAGIVTDGQVRFFLLPSSNLSAAQALALYPTGSASGASFASAYTNRLTQWVAQTCIPVPPGQWQTTVELGPLQLFDCGVRGSP